MNTNGGLQATGAVAGPQANGIANGLQANGAITGELYPVTTNVHWLIIFSLSTLRFVPFLEPISVEAEVIFTRCVLCP